MYKLRPYQEQAVDATLNYFRRTKDPAVIVLPTGAGKSLVIAELASRARGRVLVLAHVKELVEQNHAKYESYGLEAGIYSAGLNKKDRSQKVIFGSIQSVAKAGPGFFQDFSLLIVDECHRISLDQETQYAEVIASLNKNNDNLCVLGLTATPYRLGVGWIYNNSHEGIVRTEEERYFKNCIFELPLKFMIQNSYLTPPVKVHIPVTSYDFSELFETGARYTMAQVEEVLKSQRRLTPLIIKNIVEITESYHRQGVMIFSSTVKHAEEIMESLPEGQARLVIGDTSLAERDSIIGSFKNKEFKYLVNVSVLTTGFDAPHVDVIAILRPTESVSLYQQIIGRGLRLDEGKKDCFILDYTGMTHDIYAPQISDRKPTRESVAVLVPCPSCGYNNDFWGKLDEDGNIEEHYGRKCKGGVHDERSMKIIPCGFLFRFKICNKCGNQNDLSAKNCKSCDNVLVDADAKLKQARLSKNSHVMSPENIELNLKKDKNGNEYLDVKYYDLDAQSLSEVHYLSNPTSRKKFEINFLRSHLKRPELEFKFNSVEDILRARDQLRMPSYVIARMQGKFWRVTEKVFIEELETRRNVPPIWD